MSLKSIALCEALKSNQQLFLQTGNPLCTRWLSLKNPDLVLEILSARQIQKPSTEGHLIDHLAWRFPLLLLFFRGNKIPTPVWNPISDIPCSVEARTVTEGRLTLLFAFLSDSSRISREGRKQKLPPNTSTPHSIQTEGASDFCPPRRFRCSG